MPVDTTTLIWLFPIAFMVHDFEELILSDAWLGKNASQMKVLIRARFPAAAAGRMCAVMDKSAAELAVPVSLIFLTTCVATFGAAVYRQYGFFVLASELFFLHAFMHIGQAIALRRYVPAVLTSILIIVPYGLILFPHLIAERIVDAPTLLIDEGISVVVAMPFILVMHEIGSFLYRRLTGLLIR